LRKVLRQKVRPVPSGRTGAKVSARGQVCEFDGVSEDAGGATTFPERRQDRQAWPPIKNAGQL
jgi:hypothetical protein